MKEKDINKVPIMDMFDLLINSGETESLIEAIKKERGGEKTVESRADQLVNRQDVMKKLLSDQKNKETKK